MTTTSRDPKQSINTKKQRPEGSGPNCNVIVFLEEAQKDLEPVKHADRVAAALGGHVTLCHVMVPPHDGSKPVDPVDWDIRKQKTRNWLSGVARAHSSKERKTEALLLEGQYIKQIASHMAVRQGDIAAALRVRGEEGKRLSDTVLGVLASRSAALLMIPVTAREPKNGTYQKILVPLDGSSRAESALPTAAKLALAEDAELLLCHVAPQPGVTEFGVMDQEAARLSSQVTKRNTQLGQTHLTKVKNSLAHHKLNISTLIVPGGDARRALIDTIEKEAVDFVVMATHGQSGHRDVPAGDVASFILDRADIPVLMVRSKMNQSRDHAFGRVVSKGIRQPAGTDK